MSNGSRLLEGFVPEYDATVVTRILDAGVSVMSVAQREVDMAVATDQGGSIRIPSAWSGCVGLKPSHGLVPYTGCINTEPTVDHAGPIALTVSHCALMLEVMAGADGLDGRQKNVLKIPKYSQLLDSTKVSGKTLGVLKEGFSLCAEDSQRCVSDFLSTVSKAKLHTKDVSCYNYMRLCYRSPACSYHVQGYSPTSLEAAVRRGLQQPSTPFSTGAKWFTLAGELIQRRYGNHYPAKARNLILKLSAQYDSALKGCDVIVMPTLTHRAPGFIGQTDSPTKDALDFVSQSLDMSGNTVAANMTGHPALTLPLGKPGDGQTDSVMIVGRRYDEVTVLAVARALERIIPARDGLN
ncbi:amidase [Aplysia californica]|uniref:Amidase n=1 Tax=Aplysia californica TaxID=6500 RepID=A0ABM1A5L9_APLCA|nr:amidase [Aplysia californica]